MPPLDFEPGLGVPFAGSVKRAVPEAVVVAEGRITRPELGEQALRDGACDLVGMTRAQIADPELVRKAADGRAAEIRECVALNVCVARRLRKFPIACVQNPEAGFEAESMPRAASALRVVVVGAGVAGLEAARAAALAGHDVRLLERADVLGGQIALTARLPRQDAHRRLVEWRAAELERLGRRDRARCRGLPRRHRRARSGARARRHRLRARRALPGGPVGCVGARKRSRGYAARSS